ncbi:MAG: VOC family protein [bacterium]|nr:VOC family protein [bacterium]
MNGEIRLRGLHHVTLVTRDIDAMVNFLEEAVGLRLVKTTVNFDAPGQKHYYLGDEKGSPGTMVTFFEIPEMPENRLGAGGMHHIAFGVEDESDLHRQMKKLDVMGISHTGIVDRVYFKSVYFQGPENLLIEMATMGPGFGADGDQVEGRAGPEGHQA